MATITTLRPSATSSGVGWSAAPSGSLDAVTSDDSDSTYALWSGDGSAMVLPTPADEPPVGERRHLVRLRARGEDGNAWWAVRLASGALVAGASGAFGASPETISGSWQTGAPHDGSTVLSCYVTGQTLAVRIQELYLDVDSRLAPTFTPQILDGSGASTITVADTNTPTVHISALNLDSLAARQYRYWITRGGILVWDTGIVSGTPVNVQVDPLDNNNYVLHAQVWSTLGANTEYASEEEELAFTVSVGTVPEPDPPTVTPDLPLYVVEVCAPDSSGFDDYVSWIEIRRVDCADDEDLETTASIAIVGPLATDECAEWTDFTAPRTGIGGSCDADPSACCFYYQARTLGFVGGLLLVSPWSDPPVDLTCLVWSDEQHLIRANSADGPLYALVGGKFDWEVPKPFTASTGVMGARFVTSAAPGGRNLHMTAAVESEAELAELRAVLARPLVLISPSDATELWAAPVAESVRIVKIGRIRQVTADFIATGPEPAPQLADVGT